MDFLNIDGLAQLWKHIRSNLDNKVDKIDGKQLSSEDFTKSYKQLLIDLGNNVGDEPVHVQINNAISTHNHDSLYYTEKEINDMLLNKSQVQIITWEDDD